MVSVMNYDTRRFVKVLNDWQAEDRLTQRQLAELIGCHETRLSQLRGDPKDRPSGDFMSTAIARTREPWKSALKQARQADLEAADAAMAVA